MSLRRRLAIRVGGVPWMPRLLPAITAVDLRLQRLSRGRIGVLDLAGLPNLILIVAGRRSGRPRRTPLLCVPRDDGWLVAGSNFGQPQEPRWVGNLEAAPRASLVWRGRTHVVVPVELAGPDRTEAWQTLVDTWPNFLLYEQRTRRTIRVFLLCPVGPGGPRLGTPTCR